MGKVKERKHQTIAVQMQHDALVAVVVVVVVVRYSMLG